MRSVQDIVREMFETGDPDSIVPGCVISVDGQDVYLHPEIARLRNEILAQRSADRQVWLDRFGREDDDPGCHGCGNFGRHHDNYLACWCPAGERVLKAEQDRLQRQTDWLRVQESDKHNEAQQNRDERMGRQ